MEQLISLVISKARSRGWNCCTDQLIDDAAHELNVSLTPDQRKQVERLADFELDSSPWN